MVVREGTNVTLTCKAKGFPEPYVMWRREDGDEMSINGENGKNAKSRWKLVCKLTFSFSIFDSVTVNVVDGEILSITKVSRLHMAAYLCVASNGVPPSISKRVQLKVQCKLFKLKSKSEWDEKVLLFLLFIHLLIYFEFNWMDWGRKSLHIFSE
jgi:hypothetical protein